MKWWFLCKRLGVEGYGIMGIWYKYDLIERIVSKFEVFERISNVWNLVVYFLYLYDKEDV